MIVQNNISDIVYSRIKLVKNTFNKKYNYYYYEDNEFCVLINLKTKEYLLKNNKKDNFKESIFEEFNKVLEVNKIEIEKYVKLIKPIFIKNSIPFNSGQLDHNKVISNFKVRVVNLSDKYKVKLNITFKTILNGCIAIIKDENNINVNEIICKKDITKYIYYHNYNNKLIKQNDELEELFK